MFQKRGTLLRVVVLLSVACPAAAQSSVDSAGRAPAPGWRKLTGDDEKRAQDLDSRIANALKADRWDEAVTAVADLVKLRSSVQGRDNFETLTAQWRLRTLRRVAALSSADRADYRSAGTLTAAADDLDQHGKFVRALPLYEKALGIRHRLLADDDPELAESYHNLAHNLQLQGKYAAARAAYEKALEINRRALGDLHPETAGAYNNLAMNLNAIGNFAEAQALYDKAIALFQRLRGDASLEAAETYDNAALNLEDQGRYAEAQALHEKNILITRRLLGEDHVDIAFSYNNLALNFALLGDYARAQPIFEKALAVFRRLLGDDHPNSVSAFENLAANLHMQGNYALARPIFEKVLEVRRRVLTDNHPHTARAYYNVGTVLATMSENAAAQPMLEKALALRRQLLGEDHPDTSLSYRGLANDLYDQGKYSEAQVFYEKSLKISRRVLSDDHPETATAYDDLARNLDSQGKYAQAQSLHEKALEIYRRRLSENHFDTANSYNLLAANLNAQGKYAEAQERWQSAARSEDQSRLGIAFSGLGRVSKKRKARPSLAAVTARFGQFARAWQYLEEDLGRGLLDELAAREDRRLSEGERTKLRELTRELEHLDNLIEASSKTLEKGERAKRFEELKRKRELASIALGEFQSRLAEKYGASAGKVAQLGEIQSALPADAALITWVDVAPLGPNPVDPDGDHWSVIVRPRGTPVWVSLKGTGPGGFWTKDDDALADRVRAELTARPRDQAKVIEPLIHKLRAQRLEPLAPAFGATRDGLPSVRRLIVLPSRAMAGIPIEILGAGDESRTVSYAPSGTVLKYLHGDTRTELHGGLLALGDPVFEPSGQSEAPRLLPDHGLLLRVVVRGSNLDNHGLKSGDVLLAYDGRTLNRNDDLRLVTGGDKPVTVSVWRAGRTFEREIAPGDLGAVIDPQSAPAAIAANCELQKALAAVRTGDHSFAPLPGTRYEAEAIARLFQAADRPVQTLLGLNASEPELDRLATSGELAGFGYIHLATHGVIDEATPNRSAVILTQTGLPDPLEQVLGHKPVFDGRLSVREIQRTWNLKAELVTLSACETALGREAGGEGFVGFTQALLMSGARSVCLSLWKVDDKATSLLMTRFYQNLLGRRPGLSKEMAKAEALQEAKEWLRTLTVNQVEGELAALERGDVRPLARIKGAPARKEAPPPKFSLIKPYHHPYYWAAFVLVGDTD
jgi:tetratricopeptide (TPR) repeat protein